MLRMTVPIGGMLARASDRRQRGEGLVEGSAWTATPARARSSRTVPRHSIGGATRAQDRLALLAAAGRALAVPVDQEVPLAPMLRLVLRDFADLASLHLVDEAGALRSAARASSLRGRARADGPGPVQVRAFSTGRAVWLAPGARDQGGFGAPRPAWRMPASSLVAVPLPGVAGALGVLTLIRSRRRAPYTAQDLDVARELAARLATALENRRLYRRARDGADGQQQLLSLVTHDLRAPLHAIRLSVFDPARRAPAAIDRVARLAEHMDRLLDQLSDFCGVESGADRCRTSPHDVSRLLAWILDALTPLAREKGVAVRLAAPPAASVACDADGALRVFTNVVANALRFTPRGGDIEITAAARATEVQFAVRDTGPGVAPADVARVFDKHWQASKGAGRHAGLGLYIARRLIEAQGGMIRCESGPAHGTTIWFTLPRADVAPDHTVMEPAPSRHVP